MQRRKIFVFLRKYMGNLATHKAFVLAAGMGTRLRPLTDTMPKALVKVGGEPLIAHVIRKLQQAGCDEITVNVHHFADMLEEYLAKEFPEVAVSDERSQLLDTGGGILHARILLERFPATVRQAHRPSGMTQERPGMTPEGPDAFLVHNVDILSNLDLRSIPLDGVATLVVSERDSTRHLLFDEALRLVGWVDERSGEVRSPYGQIDPAKYRRLAFSGIHLLSDRIFPVFEEYRFEGRFSIIDAYLRICAKYPVRGFIPEDFKILDIGKIDTLERAAEFLKEIGG